MPQLTVTLPSGINASLFYEHDYPGGRNDYIQLARTNSLFMKLNMHQTEEKYWQDLQMNRTQFASSIPFTFDLIIDAPSNSGWHRPYSSAVRLAFPNVPCINFIKDNTGTIKPFGNNVPGLANAMNVLLVDDVFSTGKSADTVLNVLKQHGMGATATFSIACVLRIPPQPGGSIQDIADAVARLSS